MANRFSIARIVDQIGEDLTLVDVAITLLSDRGDPTTATNPKTTRGYVDYMTGEERVVEEGLLGIGDIIVYIDEDETNVEYLKLGNYFTINSVNYEIKNAIHNKGHYEVHASRI